MMRTIAGRRAADGTELLSDVVDALAGDVNGAALPGIVAIDENDVLTIVSLDGPFTVELSTPTAGAVLSASCYGLPDGSYVMLPGYYGPVYGRTLEGHPTEPHDEVNLVVPYAAGKDTVLEKGCAVAVARLKARALAR